MSDGTPTRAALEALGARTEETLRSRRAVGAALEAVRAVAPWTIPVPAVAVITTLVTGASPAAAWIVALVAFAPLALVVFVRAGRVAAEPVDPRAGLARLDRDLDLHDALRTAHEFLGRERRGAFEEAALAGTDVAYARADLHVLATVAPPRLSRRAQIALAVAVLLCLALPWLARPTSDSTPRDADVATLPPPLDVPTHAAPTPRAPVAAPPRPEAAEPRTRKPAEPSRGAKPESRTARAEAERAPRESTGKSGEGRSADASTSSNPSQSQGVPSSQSQPSTSSEPTRAPTKKPKPQAPKESTSSAKKPPQKESGATAGRGLGSGSSKNPGATDWASKDQVSTDEEPPRSEDEDVEDEDSESEARGGLQPNLRDRRPAVNRDLTIGFGNQPNPDANGRGGPSEQKKSRGVASLVLGVPIPDHVKGRPNPGRTKITQERVEPREEAAAALDASTRAPRNAPYGPVARRDLDPWMGTLLATWFQRTNTAPAAPAVDPVKAPVQKP